VNSANVVSFRAAVLGRLMRQLREDSGLTLKYVAACLGVDFGLIRRFEHGLWAATRYQVSGLLDAYREHDPMRRQRLLALAQAVWQARAELDFDGAVPDESFADLLWLEAEATKIQHYAVTAIPDLLHIPEYAEHLARAVFGTDATEQQVDARVQVTVRRQQVRQRSESMLLEVVLDECALHHPPADRQVWAAQLAHLIELDETSDVRLQVLPAAVPRPPQVVGGFTVFSLPEPLPAFVVHIEYSGGRLLRENGSDVIDSCLFGRLQELALPAKASTALITEVLQSQSSHRGKVN
jgi:transcriptional regulator with XRE-family HTH domain